jgi:hypothetical protein
MPLLLLLMLLP